MTFEKPALNKWPNLNIQAMSRRYKPLMSCFKPESFDGEPGVLCAADVDAAEPAVVAHYAQDRRYLFATRDGKGKEPHFDDDGILMIDDVYLMFGSSHILSRPQTLAAFKRTDWGEVAAYQWIMSHVQEADESNWQDFESKLPTEMREHAGQTVTFAEQWARDADVVKDLPDLERHNNKQRALALIYGLGEQGLVTQELQRDNIITKAQAKDMKDGYWKRSFPKNWAFKKKIEAKCKADGHIITQFGYRATPLHHKAFNFYIQSSVSGLVKIFLYLLFHQYCPWLVYHCVIHDEVLFSCPKDRQDEMKEAFQKAQSELNKILKWRVTMSFGLKVRDNHFVK